MSTLNFYCSLENFVYHILLIGSSIDQVLQRLGIFISHSKIIDCFYTLYEYIFFLNDISSKGEVFNQFDRTVHHNLKWEEVEKKLRVAKNEQLRKKFNCHDSDCVYFPKKFRKHLKIHIFFKCLRKKSPLLRNSQKSIQTCEQNVMFFLVFNKMQRLFHF